MRRLYALLWYLALPLLPLRLWWRGRKEPGYRLHVGERFGRYRATGPQVTGDVFWVHAVSVGETRAAAPLIERLRRARPDATILLTSMTATGRETGHALYGESVVQCWLPYDVPFAVRAFIARFRPRAGMLMETELWPTLLAECARAGVPLFLVNARLSARSAARYARAGGATRTLLASLSGVAAQTRDDAGRLEALGARDIVVTGNLKFDVDVPDTQRLLGRELRTRFGDDRPLWIAASTRDGEEALIIDALLQAPLPIGTLTLIVPRHPQRFDAVAELLGSRALPFVRRSANAPVPRDVAFVLGDSMGELAAYYIASDIAFVGGSLLPLGGQNLIEPIATGTPTLIGPHTFNFAEAAAQAIAAGAARRVADANALLTAVQELLADPGDREAMRMAASAFYAAHRGAADRLWEWLAPKLPGVSRPRDGG